MTYDDLLCKIGYKVFFSSFFLLFLYGGPYMARKINREEFFFTTEQEAGNVFDPRSATYLVASPEARTYSIPADTTTVGYLARGAATIHATGSAFKVAAKEAFVIERIASGDVTVDVAPEAVISWFSCGGSLGEALTNAYSLPTVAVRPTDISDSLDTVKNLLSEVEDEIDETCSKALSAAFFSAVTDFYYTSETLSGVSKKRLSEAERIRIYIDNMIYSNPSLDDVKEQFGITKMHAIRVFKAKYNQTPMQYAIHHRTEVAATLLATTDLPIKTISDMLHYSNTQHFSNSFKKLTGESPNQYRIKSKK